MKKFYVLLCIVIFTACSSEENIINKGVDKAEFLQKSQITEKAVSPDLCDNVVQDLCSVTLLNDITAFAYGFTISCSYPNFAYFSTVDAINDFYPYETSKDGFNTTEIRYDRFISDDPTFKFIQFSTISIHDYNNKMYLNLNNMCYEWDFSLSPYKFIK